MENTAMNSSKDEHIDISDLNVLIQSNFPPKDNKITGINEIESPNVNSNSNRNKGFIFSNNNYSIKNDTRVNDSQDYEDEEQKAEYSSNRENWKEIAYNFESSGIQSEKQVLVFCLNKVLLFFKYLPTLLFFLFYSSSLKGCYKKFFECLNTFEKELSHEILRDLIISSVFFYIQIIMVIHFMDFDFSSCIKNDSDFSEREKTKDYFKLFNNEDISSLDKNAAIKENPGLSKKKLKNNINVKCAIKTFREVAKEYFYYFLYSIFPVLILLYLFNKDQGVGFENHGGYNSSVFMVLIAIYAFLHIFFVIVWAIMKRVRKITIFVILAIIVIIYIKIHSFYSSMFGNSCDRWNYGFKGTTLKNENSQCIIESPKTCYMEILNGWLAYSYWFPQSKCEFYENNSNYESVKEILKDKTAKIIGYPRTEAYDWIPDGGRKNFNNKVRDNIINMEDPVIPASIKDNIETTVDFNFSPPKVNIHLKRKNEVAKDRSYYFQFNKHQVLAENILIFYVDSLSRPDFKRKLPRFYAFIEQFFREKDDNKTIVKSSNETDFSNNQKSNDNNTRTGEFESFQFFKYHGVGRYTVMNNVPLFWGTWALDTKSAKFFLENFLALGYMSGSAQNHCAKETVASDDIGQVEYNFYDHELNGFFCDPNNESKDNAYSNYKGANGMMPRCMYGKHTGQYALEYALQFFRVYNDTAKIFHLGLMDNHEMTAEGVSLLDDSIVAFFNDFMNQGFMSNTTVFIQSDHGHAFSGPWLIANFDDHYKELVLPSLFLIIPKKNFKNFEQIRENLLHNEHSLITPFTVYNSYQAMIGMEKELKSTKSEFNFFKDKIPYNQNCNSFYDHNYFRRTEYLCRCENPK